MRQRIRSHISYANVMVTILAFIVLGGVSYAASGGSLILGKANSASSTTSLSAPVSGKKALQVTNTSTGAGATALGLNVASGHPPFTTNSGTKVTNLNADKLDGQDSTSFVTTAALRQVGPLTVTPPDGSGGGVTIATVGHFTLTGACSRNQTSGVDSFGIQVDTDASDGAYTVMTTAPTGARHGLVFPGLMPGIMGHGNIPTGDPTLDPASGVLIGADGQQIIFNLYAGINMRNQPGQCIFGGTFEVK